MFFSRERNAHNKSSKAFKAKQRILHYAKTFYENKKLWMCYKSNVSWN